MKLPKGSVGAPSIGSVDHIFLKCLVFLVWFCFEVFWDFKLWTIGYSMA